MESSETILLHQIAIQLNCLLSGGEAHELVVDSSADSNMQGLLQQVNQFILTFNQARHFIFELAKGNLNVPSPLHNLLVSPYKQLQANLKHLAWQTQRVAEGDYSQHVDFMGDFATAFNVMVKALEEKRRVEESLHHTQQQIKHLEGIIPICSFCKKIRTDADSWLQIEKYISDHSDAQFSHGVCPSCLKKYYGEFIDKQDKNINP